MNESMNEQGLYDIYGHWHVPFWQTQCLKQHVSYWVFSFFFPLSI